MSTSRLLFRLELTCYRAELILVQPQYDRPKRNSSERGLIISSEAAFWMKANSWIHIWLNPRSTAFSARTNQRWDNWGFPIYVHFSRWESKVLYLWPCYIICKLLGVNLCILFNRLTPVVSNFWGLSALEVNRINCAQQSMPGICHTPQCMRYLGSLRYISSWMESNLRPIGWDILIQRTHGSSAITWAMWESCNAKIGPDHHITTGSQVLCYLRDMNMSGL